MDNQNPGKENKNLDSIRHFTGTWKEFEDFWKSKGARMSPWEEWNQEYPKKKKMTNKDPINMYKTFDDESDSVKESTSIDFLTFEGFVEEANLVALGGSSEDGPPMQKPFVRKRKKRKGSNEDDEDIVTPEVANRNSTGIGTN